MRLPTVVNNIANINSEIARLQAIVDPRVSNHANAGAIFSRVRSSLAAIGQDLQRLHSGIGQMLNRYESTEQQLMSRVPEGTLGGGGGAAAVGSTGRIAGTALVSGSITSYDGYKIGANVQKGASVACNRISVPDLSASAKNVGAGVALVSGGAIAVSAWKPDAPRMPSTGILTEPKGVTIGPATGVVARLVPLGIITQVGRNIISGAAAMKQSLLSKLGR